MEHDEIVYRQIVPEGNPIWCQPGREPLVHHAAFLPGPKDSDGLSLINACLRSQKWAAHRPETPEKRYRLASLLVGDLLRYANDAEFPAFDFESTPDQLDEQHGEPFAHCVATAINRTQYDSERTAKMRIKEWARSVSKSLTEQDVSGPFEPPTGDDAYRPEGYHTPAS